MASFERALQFVVDPRIQLLEKTNTLHQELERLSTMKKDTESKINTEEQRPGRSRTNLVKTWLEEVEQIKDKIEDITNQINQIFAYESTVEGFDELIKEVEEYHGNMVREEANVVRNLSIYGQGGAGNTTINQPNSRINFNYNITLGNGAVAEEHGQSNILGFGGVGPTTINQTNSPTTINSHITQGIGAVAEGHRQGHGAVEEGHRQSNGAVGE